MKTHASILRIILVATSTLLLSGCAKAAFLGYMDAGFYADHGKSKISPIYNDNDSCSVHGTCGGVTSCDLYGNC